MELALLYQSIGRAVWQLQHVEDALCTSITIKRDVKIRSGIPPEEAEELLANQRSKPLGISVRAAQESNLFCAEVQERLDRLKKERDWLVHRLVHENGDNLYEDDARWSVIERVNALYDDALEVQRVLGKDIEDYVVAQGVSREWIHAHAMQQIKSKRGV